MAKVILSKLEQHPEGRVVEFTVTTPNNHTFAMQIVVQTNNAATDEAAVALAAECLGPEIKAEIARLTAVSPLIGMDINLDGDTP